MWSSAALAAQHLQSNARILKKQRLGGWREEKRMREDDGGKKKREKIKMSQID